MDLSSDGILFGGLLSGSLFKYFVLLRLYKKRPEDAEYVGILSGINIHPVKSGAAIKLKHALCTYTGLKALDGNLRDR